MRWEVNNIMLIGGLESKAVWNIMVLLILIDNMQIDVVKVVFASILDGEISALGVKECAG